MRTIQSFHRPVILVDDILHKGYRMRRLDPILNENGTINASASRRVEILFRLKDEEMIREMIDILNSEKMNGQTPGNVVIGPGA